MELERWYKTVDPRKEVSEGRSFNPDEFAIALEQIVANKAPADYQDPIKFFARTCFTRALREHAGMVLRRLAGETLNTAPVITLVTQFGGGKTHTLTTLYHLAQNGPKAIEYTGVAEVLKEARLSSVPAAKVAVFVGNAWDPQPGRETPWIDLAWQLAGEAGVAALGPAAKDAPPGTDALNRLIDLVDQPVLLLFDEVLNALTRHKWLAEPFHAFLHNVMRGFIGSTRRAAVISLPRSQTEMTDWDLEWQEKILKIVGAVARPLIVNDEAEISEVIRRRLFENLGPERTRKRVAKAYADWCFDHRAQLPPEQTAVDTAATEAKAREFLQARFEACYPFHPATLTVFQRKWMALPQYQQTRGTLAMLAQWIAWVYKVAYTHAQRDALITLGRAPLDVPEFRSMVLGQLGESKLMAAIEADLSGPQSHARALDVDQTGLLRDIHRRVGTAILFESSGGQTDKVAHLPELRFALGGPDLDTTTIDNAAHALEARAYFVRKIGSDGFRVHHKARLKKVVNDRRSGLDFTTDVHPEMKALTKKEFERGRTLPIVPFPPDGSDIPDSPKLTLIMIDPKTDWSSDGGLRDQIAAWTKVRSTSPRLYPGALVWCIKKPGRQLQEKVETLLAWRRVKRDVDSGLLGNEFDPDELANVKTEVKDAEDEAREEVWASYRFVVLHDLQEADGLRTIDLGGGYASSNETLCGRIIGALKSGSLLNESPGPGYLERHWPAAFKESGAWPLISLRQAFLNGSLGRLLDADLYLRAKVPEFVGSGEFGLASGQKPDGTYERLWFKEPLLTDEIAFESDIYLVKKARAQQLKSEPRPAPTVEPSDDETKPAGIEDEPIQPTPPTPPPPTTSAPQVRQLRLFGDLPPESWNRLGTKLIPKLRSGQDLKVEVAFTVKVEAAASKNLIAELKQILDDLGIADKVKIDEK